MMAIIHLNATAATVQSTCEKWHVTDSVARGKIVEFNVVQVIQNDIYSEELERGGVSLNGDNFSGSLRDWNCQRPYMRSDEQDPGCGVTPFKQKTEKFRVVRPVERKPSANHHVGRRHQQKSVLCSGKNGNAIRANHNPTYSRD
jgi:hypothetical protein